MCVCDCVCNGGFEPRLSRLRVRHSTVHNIINNIKYAKLVGYAHLGIDTVADIQTYLKKTNVLN